MYLKVLWAEEGRASGAWGRRGSYWGRSLWEQESRRSGRKAHPSSPACDREQGRGALSPSPRGAQEPEGRQGLKEAWPLPAGTGCRDPPNSVSPRPKCLC